MSLQHDLTKFLEDRLKESGIDDDCVLEDSTMLLTSKLISSLNLLELAIWIEKHMAAPIDLKTIDPVKEWDTIGDILRFITRHSAEAKK
ncbi:MAG: hypothetical protein O7F12_01115 [Nitrospirae bacterium]|nr:hypothetical protein [Nitrospirota bacterium]